MNKKRTIFPLLKDDQTVLLIFSYVDVLHRSIDLLKRLNSRSYDLVRKLTLKQQRAFKVYLKSPQICTEIKPFLDQEILSEEINKKLWLKLQLEGTDNAVYDMLRILREGEENSLWGQQQRMVAERSA